MDEHDVRAAQARIDAMRGGRPQAPRPEARRGGPPQSLEDALRRVVTGEVTPWATDEEIALYEAAKARRERHERVIALGLDQMLTDDGIAAAVDDAFAATVALDRVRRWVAYQAGERTHGSKPVVVLLGPPGVGKTVAAAWLLLAEGGRYVSASELAVLHSARWGAERERYQSLLGSRVLVVDEIGTEADRSAAAAIHEVIDRRQASPRLTLLLGNIRKRQLAERYDARTLDRLRACATVIELTGQSMRRGQL